MKNTDRSKVQNTECGDLEVIASVAASQANDKEEGMSSDLLSAFKSGIEKSLALVHQMSTEERAVAFSTIASLCGEANQIAKLFQDQSSDSNTVKEKGQNLRANGSTDRTGSNNDDTQITDQNNRSDVIQTITTRNGKKPELREKSKRLLAKRNASTVHSPQKKKYVRKTAKKESKDTETDAQTKDIEINDHSPTPDRNNDESDSDGTGDVSSSPVDKNVNLNDDKVFKCEICNKKLKSRFSLLVHKRIHTGEKPYLCHLCDKTFSCSNNCRRHIRETHEGSRPFNCSRCSMGFFRQLQLEKHLTEEHDLSTTEVKEEQQKNTPKRELQVYNCKDCGKLFKTKSNLRVHKAVHLEERQHPCPHCPKKFSFRTNLKRHVMLHTGIRPHQCDVCKKGFIEYKSLKHHISREHGCPDMKEPDKFTCEECGRQLSTRASLHNHKLTHSGSKPHVCPVCKKAFSMKSNLKRHIRGHSNDKPWECPTCFKRFTEKKTMEVHFRVHTGEKPYSCTDCGKSFAQASTLQAHMPVHSKERAVSCEICGKSFLRKSHYRFHIAKHQNPPKHSCSDCPRAFYRKADLHRHRLTHTGERPYHCKICPRQFSRALYLKDHLNVHLGQRPYVCAHCPATFAESSARVKHMRRCPMRVTSKPLVTQETIPGPQQQEDSQSLVQDGMVVADYDIVTTAMTSAALNSITMTPAGLAVDDRQTVVEQQQVSTAADNLVALANSGIITLQAGALDLEPKTALEGEPCDVTSFDQLGVQAIDVNTVKEVHVQDVDTGTGKTKHYIVVIQPRPVTQ